MFLPKGLSLSAPCCAIARNSGEKITPFLPSLRSSTSFNATYVFASRSVVKEFASPFAGEFVPDNEFVRRMFARFDAERLFHTPQEIAIFAIFASKNVHLCVFKCFYVRASTHTVFLNFPL